MSIMTSRYDSQGLIANKIFLVKMSKPVDLIVFDGAKGFPAGAGSAI